MLLWGCFQQNLSSIRIHFRFKQKSFERYACKMCWTHLSSLWIWTLLLCRFNGEDFLRRLKGKSLMFVGDSLSLNQWQSLTCMLHSALPSAPYSSVKNGGLSIFTFPVRHLFIRLLSDFRFSIEFFSIFLLNIKNISNVGMLKFFLIHFKILKSIYFESTVKKAIIKA